MNYTPGAVKTYYELLELTPDASAEDIKRAFRREIAKYHPDKVQHLGREFQEIAATKAAELTQAYKTLSDPEQRAEYDELLADGHAPQPVVAAPSRPVPDAAPQPPRTPDRPPPQAPSSEPRGPQFGAERQGLSDLVRRATVIRFQNALLGEFGKVETLSVAGFEVAVLPTPNFWSLKPPPRVLGRFLPVVNGQAVAETWSLAAKMKDNQRDLCVFLMGPQLASATELAVAIAEQRKKPMPGGGKLVLIPVNTNDWSAHVPTDAPNVCKSVLARLKSNT